jgi:hypothetical protein
VRIEIPLSEPNQQVGARRSSASIGLAQNAKSAASERREPIERL